MSDCSIALLNNLPSIIRSNKKRPLRDQLLTAFLHRILMSKDHRQCINIIESHHLQDGYMGRAHRFEEHQVHVTPQVRYDQQHQGLLIRAE